MEQKKQSSKIWPVLLYLAVGLAIAVCLWFQRDLDKYKELSAESYEDGLVTEVEPGFMVPAGEYLIDVHVVDSGNVPEARLRFYSLEDGEIFIGDINNGISVNTYSVRLEKAYTGLYARIEYPEGMENRIQVTGFTIWGEEPLYQDAMFALVFFVTAYVLFGAWFFSGRKPGKEWYYAGAIVLAVLFSSYPLFSSYLTESHDLNFQLYRIEGIKDGLLCGQFPVRVHPTHLNGYGYGTGALYPELFLYIPAILRILGLSPVLSFKIFLFLINTATALVMYFAVKSVTKSPYYGTLASVAYTMGTYRVICVHERAAVGEILAMCFMPLVVSGIYHVFLGDKRKWPQLVLGATFVFQSHLIGTVFTAFLAVFLGIVYSRNLFRERRWLTLLGSIGMILLLNLWFLVPFFDFYSQDLVQHHISDGGNIFHDHVIIPAELLNLIGDNYGLSYELSHGILGEMSQTLGIGVSLCLGLGIVLFFVKKKGKDCFALPLFFFGILVLAGSTSLLPWKRLEGIGLVNALTTIIQFPWRLLGLVTLAIVMSLAFCGAKEYPALPERWKRGLLAAFTGIGIYGCVAFGAAATEGNSVYLEKAEAINLNSTVGMNQEYLLYGTDTSLLEGSLYTPSEDGCYVSGKSKKGTTVEVAFVNGLEDAWIEVPLLWYPGYRAIDLETGRELPLTIGTNNVIRVQVPYTGMEGSGSFRVYYAGRGRYRVGELASILTVLGWAAAAVYRRKRREPAQKKRKTAEIDNK